MDKSWPKTYGSQMIQLKESSGAQNLLMIGGSDNTMAHAFVSFLYKLTCQSQNKTCKWEKMPQQLKIPRTNSVAIKMPDDLAFCRKGEDIGYLGVTPPPLWTNMDIYQTPLKTTWTF